MRLITLAVLIYVAAKMKKANDPDVYIEPRTTPSYTKPTEEPGSGYDTDDLFVLGSIFDDVMFWVKNRDNNLTNQIINKNLQFVPDLNFYNKFAMILKEIINT